MAFYYYKVKVDAGGAPCVRQGMLSLAICKPMLRATVQNGDIVIGLAANNIHRRNGVVYIARVTQCLQDGQYYRDSRYQRRPDCIYRFRFGEWIQIRNSFHSPADIDRDLGRRREHTQVIISLDFRYFGKKRFDVDWTLYPELRKKVDRLMQGHRVRHSEAVERELTTLSKRLFALSRRKVVGKPTHAERGPCNREDEDPVGVC